MDGPAVVCEGLTKRYGSRSTPSGLDLEMPRGTSSGSWGRTARARPRPCASSPVWAARRAVVRSSPARVTGSARRRWRRGSRTFGYLDQDPRFYGWMKGRELLGLVADLDGIAGPSRAPRSSTRPSRSSGWRMPAGRRIGGYSGGMRQRIGLAAALLEPAAGALPRRTRQLARPRRAATTSSTSSGASAARPRSSCRPTSSTTWSVSATGSGSWTAAGS